MKNKIKIYKANPRGFCAGVIKAEKILTETINTYSDDYKVYVRKQIVHNKYIISRFEEKGVIFVDEVNLVPENSIIVYSAHGVSPFVRKKSNDMGLKEVDATCPFVKKVHRSAVKLAEKSHHIIYIGDRNHEEAIGTTEEAVLIYNETGQENKVHIINSVYEAKNLQIKNDGFPISCITQTTLNIDDLKNILDTLREKYPDRLELPGDGDICYATKNRQDALKTMISKYNCELVLVVGSNNSSNSRKLVETAIKQGTEAFLIDTYKDINPDWISDCSVVGITSGASAPEILIDEVEEYLTTNFNADVGEYIYKEERVNF